MTDPFSAWCVVLVQDLAPVVLYSSSDLGTSQARLPSGQSQLPSGQSPWQRALPGTVEEDILGLNGFRSPSMCKEVFQFEAQETTAVQATQHVQRFLTAGSSMRGSGSIALPPVAPVQVCLSDRCACLSVSNRWCCCQNDNSPG